MPLLIRHSRDDDLPAIVGIYTQAVLNNTGTFEIDPPDIVEMTKRREKILSSGLPYLVAEIDGKIVGYSYAGVYNPRAAYRFTVEDTVYVDAKCRRQGIGTTLLQALIDRCEASGHRLMVAVIGDHENKGSIGIHTKCGFQPAGGFSNCGWKFDRWLSVVYMERSLGAGAATSPISKSAA